MPRILRLGSRTMVRRLCALGVIGLAPLAVQAQVINIPFKATYRASLEIRAFGYQSLGCTSAYRVPAGQTFRVTDYVLDAYSATQPLRYQYLCTGSTACETLRTNYMTAPIGTSLVNNMSTGIRVDAGQTLFVCNASSVSGSLGAWTLNGFLYTVP